MTLSIVGSAWTRHLVSNALEIPKAIALPYNMLDMVISGLAQVLLYRQHPDDLRAFLGSRVISILLVSTISTILAAPISALNILALNIYSFIVGWSFHYTETGDFIGGVWQYIVV